MAELTNYKDLAVGWLKAKNPTLTPEQQAQFIMFCKAFKLNPWKNEAYAISFGGTLTLVTNYLVICARAKQNPKYYREELEYYQAGKKLEYPALTPMLRGVVIVVKIYDKEGNIISNYPFNVDENANACTSTFKKTRFQSWAEKCAITNALRRTFPNEVGELYTPEEITRENESVSVSDTNKHPNISKVYTDSIQYLNSKIQNPVKRLEITNEFQKLFKISKDDMIMGNYEPNKFNEFVEGYVEDAQQKPNT